MLRYEYVSTAIFDEPDFEDENWSSDTLLLYLYLIIAPRGNGITGIARVSDAQICRHLRLSPERLEAAIAQLGPRLKRYPDHWLWLRGRFKHACTSPNHCKAAIANLVTAPDQLRADFLAHYANGSRFGSKLATMLQQALDSTCQPSEAPSSTLVAPPKPLASPSQAPSSPLPVRTPDYDPILTPSCTTPKANTERTPNPLKGAAAAGRETKKRDPAQIRSGEPGYWDDDAIAARIARPVSTKAEIEAMLRHTAPAPAPSPTSTAPTPQKPLTIPDHNNPANFISEAELEAIEASLNPTSLTGSSSAPSTTRCETSPEPPQEPSPGSQEAPEPPPSTPTQ